MFMFISFTLIFLSTVTITVITQAAAIVANRMINHMISFTSLTVFVATYFADFLVIAFKLIKKTGFIIL